MSMNGSTPSIVKMSLQEVLEMPELKVNPFAKRMCTVFSSDGLGNLTFDDFLDMFSVLSEAAPLSLKLNYFFKIFDFDNDGLIGKRDVLKAIRLITKVDHLTRSDIEYIISQILREGDFDEDGALSFVEFQYVVSRSSDVARTFRIRM